MLQSKLLCATFAPRKRPRVAAARQKGILKFLTTATMKRIFTALWLIRLCFLKLGRLLRVGMAQTRPALPVGKTAKRQ